MASSSAITSLSSGYIMYMNYLINNNTSTIKNPDDKKRVANYVKSLVETMGAGNNTQGIDYEKVVNSFFPFVKYKIGIKDPKTNKFVQTDAGAKYITQFRTIYTKDNFESNKLIDYDGLQKALGGDIDWKKSGTAQTILTNKSNTKKLYINVPSSNSLSASNIRKNFTPDEFNKFLEFIKLLIKNKNSFFLKETGGIVHSALLTETIFQILSDKGISNNLKGFYLPVAIKYKILAEFKREIAAEASLKNDIAMLKGVKSQGTKLSKETIITLKEKGVFYTDNRNDVGISGFTAANYNLIYANKSIKERSSKNKTINLETSTVYAMPPIRKGSTTKADSIVPLIYVDEEDFIVREVGVVKISIKEPTSRSLEGSLNFNKIKKIYNLKEDKAFLNVFALGIRKVFPTLRNIIDKQNSALLKFSDTIKLPGKKELIYTKDLAAINGNFAEVELMPKSAREEGGYAVDLIPLLIEVMYPSATSKDLLKLNSSNKQDVSAFFDIISIVSALYSGKRMTIEDVGQITDAGSANAILVIYDKINADLTNINSYKNELLWITDKNIKIAIVGKNMDIMQKHEKPLLEKLSKVCIKYNLMILQSNNPNVVTAKNIAGRLNAIPLFITNSYNTKFIVNEKNMTLYKMLTTFAKSGKLVEGVVAPYETDLANVRMWMEQFRVLGKQLDLLTAEATGQTRQL